MNVLDIIVLIIFSLSILICAIKGLLKILSGVGSFAVAFIVSKLFGNTLGERFLGEALGSFAGILGTLVLFVALLLLTRIIFFLLAKLITKVLHAKGLDKFLGALVGAVGGVAGIYVLSLALGLVMAVLELVGANTAIPSLVESSMILKYFM